MVLATEVKYPLLAVQISRDVFSSAEFLLLVSFLFILAAQFYFYRNKNEQLKKASIFSSNKAEDASNRLTESEHRFLELCRLVPELVIETDTQGHIIFASESTALLTGYSTEKLTTDLTISDLLQPDCRADVYDCLTSSVQDQDTVIRELRLLDADGNSVPVRTRIAAIKSADEQSVQGMRLIFVDISSEVHSQQVLEQKRAIEHTITKILDSFSKVTTGELDSVLAEALVSIGGLTTVDRFFMLMTGKSDSTLNWEYQWHAEGIEKLDDSSLLSSLDGFPWLAGQIEKKRVIHVEDVAALPDEACAERERWLELGICSVLGIPMLKDGEVIGFMSFHAVSGPGNWQIEDIRLLETLARILAGDLQRRDAERELRSANTRLMDIIEFLPDATLVIDGSGKVVAWNRSMEEITGIPKEDMIGKGDYAYAVPFYGEAIPVLIDHFGDADLGHWRQLYKYVEINNDTLYAESFVPFLNNGKGAYLWFTASPLFDNEGRIVGAIESIRDISYRKKSEEALRESQRTLSTLMSSLPGMVYRCLAGSAWSLEFVSEGCRELTGRHPSDMLGETGTDFLDLIYPDDRDTVVEGLSEAVNNKNNYRLEHRVLSANGTIRWVLHQGQATFDELGDVLFYEGVLTDITEGKCAEIGLRQSEEKYRRLVETMNDGMGVIDADGTLTYVNERLCTMTGFRQKDLLGEKVTSFLHDLSPEFSVAMWPGWYNETDTAQETEIIRRDNTKLPVRINPVPILAADSSFAGGFAIISDMTSIRDAEDRIRSLNADLELRVIESTHELIGANRALQTSEARYRRIIENLQEDYIFYSHDLDGHFTYMSPSYRQVLGYQRLDELLELISQWARQPENTEARQCSEKSRLGFRQSPYELHVQHQDGSFRIMEILEVPVFNSSGEVVAVEGLGRDVSVKHQNLNLIKEAQEKLVESEKMAALGNLVAGLSHEINTPLGIGVTGSSHLTQLAKQCSSSYEKEKLTRSGFEYFIDSVQETADLVQNNLNRAADLLQNFKQVSSDQSSGEERVFELDDYLNDVFHSFRPQLRNTGFDVFVQCPQGIQLKSYPGALYQVFSNLVMNSLKHGFDGMIVGKISVNVRLDNKGVVIEYNDNGNGMSREQVSRIYEPFYTTKRGRGGTGLGMHIVYNNVTQTLGGIINCVSKPGRGTQFTIELPLLAEVAHG